MEQQTLIGAQFVCMSNVQGHYWAVSCLLVTEVLPQVVPPLSPQSTD